MEIQYQVKFDTCYQAGTITAVSYCGGKECGRTNLKTAGETVQLLASTEIAELKSGGQDIIFLEIAAADSDGVINTSFSEKVKIDIEGPGIIQGFGSADPLSVENFFDRERTAFDGRLLAVIRSAKTAGEINVSLTVKGLPNQEIKLISK